MLQAFSRSNHGPPIAAGFGCSRQTSSRILLSKGNAVGLADGSSRLPLPTADFAVDCTADVFVLEGFYPGVLSLQPLSGIQCCPKSSITVRMPAGVRWKTVGGTLPRVECQGNCCGATESSCQPCYNVNFSVFCKSHPGVSKMKAVARISVY